MNHVFLSYIMERVQILLDGFDKECAPVNGATKTLNSRFKIASCVRY
jgi:hypothetical protein